MNAQYHVHSQYNIASSSGMAGAKPDSPCVPGTTPVPNAYLWMFGNGALASCIAEATTLPLEVTKVRQQCGFPCND